MTKQLAIAMRDYFLKHGEEELTALWEEEIEGGKIVVNGEDVKINLKSGI